MDVVIFGGGVAGLWLLDELRRRGRSAILLEAQALGTGQTVAAQGILHGGLKYTLQGLLTKSAAKIREMPEIWRACLDGRQEPNLSSVRRRSDECFLWRTESLSSRLGMWGAQVGLRVTPQSLSVEDRPEVLRRCPGTVARLSEQVISTVSLLEVLAACHRGHVFQASPADVSWECRAPGEVTGIHLRGTCLRPRWVVFTAGAGNGALRRAVHLENEAMQRRPLHMVLVRGALPALHGHCVDGAKTRVTITSDSDIAGRVVWQVGGQIAEDGVSWDAPLLIEHARRELSAVLPNVDFSGTEWATYRVDRAEGWMPRGQRPETVQVRCDGNCVTAWPTKLALAPQLAVELCDRLESELGSAKPVNAQSTWPSELSGWPVPCVALPPWETAQGWIADADIPRQHDVCRQAESKRAA